MIVRTKVMMILLTIAGMKNQFLGATVVEGILWFEAMGLSHEKNCDACLCEKSF